MDEGWTYGEKRDDIHKKHPCLVSYDELPEEEKRVRSEYGYEYDQDGEEIRFQNRKGGVSYECRWFDRIIYGGAWKQIRFLIIIVISLIVLSCLGSTLGKQVSDDSSRRDDCAGCRLCRANHSFREDPVECVQ